MVMAYKRQSPGPISEGYTNALSMANTNGTAYFDGTKVNTVNPGTALQILKSNGAGMAPTFQSSSGGSGVSIIGFTSQNDISPNRYLATTTTDSYLAPFGFRNPGADSSGSNIVICPLTGTFSNMYVYISQNLSTTDVTFNLITNGINSLIAVTVPAGTTGLFSDTTHSIGITAAQTVQMFCQQATTGNVYGSISIQFS
jgi:hypothetical protein